METDRWLSGATVCWTSGMFYFLVGILWVITAEGIFSPPLPEITDNVLRIGGYFFLLLLGALLPDLFSRLTSSGYVKQFPADETIEPRETFAYQYRVDPSLSEWQLEEYSGRIENLIEIDKAEKSENQGEDFVHFMNIMENDRSEVMEKIKEALDTGESYELEYRITGAEGEIEWVRDNGRGRYNEAEELIAIAGDVKKITEIKSAQQDAELAKAEAEYLARHDTLTGLPNRGVFLEKVTQIFSESTANQSEGYLFCAVDILDFQKYNNFYGYWLGNRILERTTAFLRERVPEDALLGRLGNDEFGILLPVGRESDVQQIIKDHLAPLKNSFEADGNTIEYHMRVGAARYPEDGTSLEELLGASYRALDREKRGRGMQRNKILVHQESDLEQLELQIKSSEKLIEALEANRLEVHYQPVYDSRNGSIYMFEALMRIFTKSGEVRTLQNYSEIVNNPQLSSRLDRWVVNKVVEQISQLPEQKTPEYISINLFPASILRRDVFAALNERLEKSGVPKDRIIIEITEKLLGGCSARAFQNLMKVVEEYGFNIALDDFGVGHGSFQTLKELPLDMIKIDGTFIVNLEDSDMNLKFVRSLANLSRDIDIPVVGEWIETKKTAEILQDLGVYYHQGYYYEKPCRLDKAVATC